MRERKLTRAIIQRAIFELAMATGEFTQYDLHLLLGDMLGRELTQREKIKATEVARSKASVKEVKRDPATKVRVYIFML